MIMTTKGLAHYLGTSRISQNVSCTSLEAPLSLCSV